jgi:hypothetical protein
MQIPPLRIVRKWNLIEICETTLIRNDPRVAFPLYEAGEVLVRGHETLLHVGISGICPAAGPHTPVHYQPVRLKLDQVLVVL